MRERGIPFSGRLPRLILDDVKTQTRRIVKPQPPTHLTGTLGFVPWVGDPKGLRWVWTAVQGDWWLTNPYGVPGDRLWVREPWRVGKGYDELPGSQFTSPYVFYEADRNLVEVARGVMLGRYRHGRFMPRWASRITVEIISVRIERLRDISEEDAQAEGADRADFSEFTDEEIALLDYPSANRDTPYRNAFSLLWDSLNGPGSWNANPWVWVISFKRMES